MLKLERYDRIHNALRVFYGHDPPKESALKNGMVPCPCRIRKELVSIPTRRGDIWEKTEWTFEIENGWLFRNESCPHRFCVDKVQANSNVEDGDTRVVYFDPVFKEPVEVSRLVEYSDHVLTDLISELTAQCSFDNIKAESFHIQQCAAWWYAEVRELDLNGCCPPPLDLYNELGLVTTRRWLNPDANGGRTYTN